MHSSLRGPLLHERARNWNKLHHRCGAPQHTIQHVHAYRTRTLRRALQHEYDVVALGNLCVDLVVPVDQLPSVDKPLLQSLSGAPPSTDSWEVGGSCNFTIAAARLGLKAATVGHVAADVYGNFLRDILKDENVTTIERIAPDMQDATLDQTLLCFVLVDPNSKHAFCSRYDFGPWPLLSGIQKLPHAALQVLAKSRAVFTNGFLFDELPLAVVVNAIEYAASSGASIFFDPGPRCHTMKTGSRRVALESMMDLSHVVLMTQEEAQEVTGCTDPEAAAKAVLSRPNSRTEWCIIKMGGDGAVLCTRSHINGTFRATALKVEVTDTVGCGDSFAAAVVLGYIRHHDISSTMVLANAVGAATAMGRGAGRNVANAGLVMDLLTSHAARANGNGAVVHSAIDILRDSLDTSAASLSSYDTSGVC